MSKRKPVITGYRTPNVFRRKLKYKLFKFKLWYNLYHGQKQKAKAKSQKNRPEKD
jgi:hypothetical protein